MNWNWIELSDEEKLQRRVWLTINENDKEVQALIRGLVKDDPIMFIELLCWTKDPKKKPSRLPFILYPFQRALIEWLEAKLNNQESGLIEKSRQMGITWIVMCWLLHHWLFTLDFVALIGSRKEELVDKRDKADTLFEKLDYNFRYLPKWIIPKKYEPNKDRRHLIVVNPNTHGVIYGESANKDFGRGATLSLAFLDEFASWAEAESSYNSVIEATHVTIPVSTPKAFSYFKALRFSKQIDVKTVHWKQHPERGDEWYKRQVETKSAEAVAQEIDISYDVTGRGKVYEEIDLVQVGKYPYNPKWPIYTATDYGLKDPTAILWVQQDPETKKVYIIDCYWNEDKTIDFYIPFYTGEISKELSKKYSYTFSEKQQIKEHSKWKKPRHFGDPAGKQRGQVTNTSVIRELSKAGVFVFTNDKANHFAPRREATKMLLRVLYVNKTKQNDYFVECIKQSRYPERQEVSQATTAIAKPVHDWTSHFRSALEYLAVNLGIKRAKPKKLNYLKRNTTDSEGALKEVFEEKEKKKRIIRYSFRSYGL